MIWSSGFLVAQRFLLSGAARFFRLEKSMLALARDLDVQYKVAIVRAS
jgi:hypothetical protein